MPSPKELLDFVDDYFLDDQLYWRVPGKDQANRFFEIQWRKANGKRGWQMRGVGSSDWIKLSKEQLMTKLTEFNVDTEVFLSQLARKVLTQAVYANMVSRAAEQLMGRDAITKAEGEIQNLLEGIRQAVQQHLSGKKSSQEPQRGELVVAFGGSKSQQSWLH